MDSHEMFRRLMTQGLLGKTDANYSTTGSIPTSNESPMDAINKALEAVRKISQPPEPKIYYCSWAGFVGLLMMSDFVITAGYKTSDITWRFELNGSQEIIVSEAIPVDDKVIAMKPIDWDKMYRDVQV